MILGLPMFLCRGKPEVYGQNCSIHLTLYKWWWGWCWKPLKISIFYAYKNIVFFWSFFFWWWNDRIAIVYRQNHNVRSWLEVRQGISLIEAANTETIAHAAFEDDPFFSCTSCLPNKICCPCFNILWLCKKIVTQLSYEIVVWETYIWSQMYPLVTGVTFSVRIHIGCLVIGC